MNPALQQGLRYAAVMGVGYAVDLGVYFALFAGFAVPPLWANAAAKLVSSVVSFFAHRQFTFAATDSSACAQAAKYFSLVALNVPLSSAVLAGVLWLWPNPYWGKIAADVLMVCITFVQTKFLVFGKAAR
jgi:putative flippase GtrA